MGEKRSGSLLLLSGYLLAEFSSFDKVGLVKSGSCSGVSTSSGNLPILPVPKGDGFGLVSSSGLVGSGVFSPLDDAVGVSGVVG